MILKTKTFWGGIASVASGIGCVVAKEYSAGIILIIGGLQAIFIRSAIANILTGLSELVSNNNKGDK